MKGLVRRTSAAVSLATAAILLVGALLTGSCITAATNPAHAAAAPNQGHSALAGPAAVREMPTPGPIRNYHFESVQLAASNGVPTWLAYDSGVHAFYVAQSNSSVAVIPSGSLSVATTIPVGSLPFGVAYDPTDGRVFVADSGTNTVSVISDLTNTTIGSVTVGWNPHGVAYDPVAGLVYVANGGSNSVTVFNARTLDLVATIGVGNGPIGIAFDPVTPNIDSVNGTVYVANGGSATVSVIDPTDYDVVDSVPVGTAPYGVAVDNSSGAVFVSNAQSGNVSYILGGTAIPIVTGGTPQGLTFDWRNNTIWVADGSIFVVVINATTHQVVEDLVFDPRGAAYDPDNNDVCVTNAANGTFECLVANRARAWDLISNISFTESGLPLGTFWAVSFSDDFGSSELVARSPVIEFQATLDFYPGFQVAPASGYSASPSSGLLTSYRGGANINITFSPAPGTYLLTIVETGLDFSPWSDIPLLWGAEVGGTAVTATDSTAALAVHNGTFDYTAGLVSGFWAPPPGSVGVHGGDVSIVINYTLATFGVTFVETGLASGQSWGVSVDGTHQSTTSSSLVFQEANGTYAYSIDPVSGYALATATGTFTVNGGGLSEGASFSGNPFTPIGLSPTGGFLLVGTLGLVLVAVAVLGIVLYRRRQARRARGDTGQVQVPRSPPG